MPRFVGYGSCGLEGAVFAFPATEWRASLAFAAERVASFTATIDWAPF